MAFSSPLVETASVLAVVILLGWALGRIAANKLSLGAFIIVMVRREAKFTPKVMMPVDSASSASRSACAAAR